MNTTHPTRRNVSASIRLDLARHRLITAADAPPGARVTLDIPAGMLVDPELDRVLDLAPADVRWHVVSSDPDTASRWYYAIRNGSAWMVTA